MTEAACNAELMRAISDTAITCTAFLAIAFVLVVLIWRGTR